MWTTAVILLLAAFSTHEAVSTQTNFAVQIVSRFNHRVDVYFDDHSSGVFVSEIEAHESKSFNAFAGHTLYVKGDQPGERLASITIKEGVLEYEMIPASPVEPTLASGSCSRYVLGWRRGGIFHDPRKMFVTIRNLQNVTFQMRWTGDPDRDSIEIVDPGSELGLQTFIGHSFNAVNSGVSHATITMIQGKHFYVLSDEGSDVQFSALASSTRDTEAGMDAYFAETGLAWHGFWRRPPPAFHMWEAAFEQQRHMIRTEAAHYQCLPLDAADLSTKFGVVITSRFDHRIRLFWANHTPGVLVAEIEPQRATTVQTYAGHTFYVEGKQPGGWAAAITIKTGILEYEIPAAFKGLEIGMGEAEEAAVSTGDKEHPECRAPEGEVLELELTVLSLKPKIFLVENFLSEPEINYIIKKAAPLMTRSTTGIETDSPETSKKRTSSSTFLQDSQSALLDHLKRRAADLLRIDGHLLRGECKECKIELQVVRYTPGQEYTPHTDVGIDQKQAEHTPNVRYLTLLLYLSDQTDAAAGGETIFPRAFGDEGLRVHPGKGAAVLFYNLLADGNSDERSLHGSLPVRHGVKWLANFWVWTCRQPCQT
jgi:prolyl 4-hydroxylase